jgi:hypothetical protein
MRGQEERLAAGAIAAESAVDGRAAGDRLQELGLQTGGLETALEVPGDTSLAVGAEHRRWVDGWDPDQVLERRHDPVVRRGPLGVADRGGRAGREDHR